MFKKFRIRDYDFKLIFMVVALSIIGAYAIGSAQPSLQSKQFAGILGGILIMFVVSVFNYSFLLKFYWLMYALNIGLLLGVMLAGVEGGLGAQRWFQIGGLRFQPSETAKILLILFFAQFIMVNREKLNTFRTVLLSIMLIAVPMVLVKKQPDLSTTIMIAILFCVMMYIGGISHRLILGVLAVTIPLAVIFLTIVLQPEQKIIESYQQKRILAWLYPDDYPQASMQSRYSMYAIGFGGILGRGLGRGTMKYYLPFSTNDFIFGVIGEELGLVGCGLVVFLFVYQVWRIFTVARHAKDKLGSYMAFGVGIHVALQVILNIGVATGVLPNTGISLPYISYGGTALLLQLCEMGIVLNISRQIPGRRVRIGDSSQKSEHEEHRQIHAA